VQIGLSAAGALVGHESMTGRNILDWWGGAIEVAFLNNGRFEKLSNVLHTTWRVLRKDGAKYEVRLVPKFIKYDYVGDVFVAQTLDLTVQSGDENMGQYFHVNEHALRLYTPLLKGRRQYDFSGFVPPDFSHKTLCCFIFVEQEEPNLGNLVRVYHNPDGDSPFRLLKSDLNDPQGRNEIVIGFHERLKADIEGAIKSATGLPVELCQIGP
jgi:hypothetical protein